MPSLSLFPKKAAKVGCADIFFLLSPPPSQFSGEQKGVEKKMICQLGERERKRKKIFLLFKNIALALLCRGHKIHIAQFFIWQRYERERLYLFAREKESGSKFQGMHVVKLYRTIGEKHKLLNQVQTYVERLSSHNFLL